MFKRHYTPQYTTSFSSDVTGNVVMIDWATEQKFMKKLGKLCMSIDILQGEIVWLELDISLSVKQCLTMMYFFHYNRPSICDAQR